MNTINVYDASWKKQVVDLACENHLFCTGKRSDLQWFGTNLIAELAKLPDTETGTIYGKLATNLDDFCYQLCHSTPWGFEMGRNLNAVNDVLRGENEVQNKFHILFDAQYFYLHDFTTLKQLTEIFFELGEEKSKRNQNQKVILLLEDSENISIRKLIKHKEKYPIKVLNIIQEQSQ